MHIKRKKITFIMSYAKNILFTDKQD